jgi:hypothetical protein
MILNNSGKTALYDGQMGHGEDAFMDDFELEVSSLREAEKQSGMVEGETRADRQDGEIRQQAQRLSPRLPVADTRDRDIVRQTGAPDQS